MRAKFWQRVVACQYTKARLHLAAGGVGHKRLAPVQPQHGAVLKDAHTQTLRSARQTQPVFERMQVPRRGIKRAGVVARAADMSLHITAQGQVHRKIVVARHDRHLGLQGARLARRIGHVQVALDPVAGDAKVANALINQIQRLQRQVPRQTRLRLAQLVFKRFLATGKTSDRLTTVAP